MVASVLIAPWLIPPQGVPSPSVLPWLFSLGCTGLLAHLWSVGNQGSTRAQKQDAGAVLSATWLMAALLSSVIGLCQYFGVAQYFAFMSDSSSGEAFANLRQRNQFASLTSIGLLAVLWWAAQVDRLKKDRGAALGLMLATVLLALGNAASSSRTGLLQLGFIAMTAGWWSRSSPTASARLVRRLLLSAVFSYLLAALVLPVMVGQALGGGIFARLQDGGPACSSRMVLWSNVLQLIAQKPGLGWGWGELRYAHFMTLYDGPRFCEIMGKSIRVRFQLNRHPG